MKPPANYQPRRDLLADRQILVTGATGALGRALSLALADHGATVILHGRDQGRLERVYDEISARQAPEPAMFVLDLELESERMYGSLAQTIYQEFGDLHGLVHCANFFPYFSRIDDYEAEIWRKVMQINLNAAFLMTQALLPLLRLSKDASLVFTLDADCGRQARAYWGAYGASKAALRALMQSLAAENEEAGEIRCNAVDPGPMRSNLRARSYPGEDPGGHPEPQQKTAAYLYLLGEDSRGVTGQELLLGATSGETQA
jgi:NAD(P)-dependent dehydrogenase (short-subunit alcohol dehydrogenase family)